MRRLVRRLWPDSLVGRTLAVLFAGLLLTQLAGILMFSNYRFEATSRLGRNLAAERIASVVQLVEEGSADDRARVIRTSDRAGLRIGWAVMPLTTGDGDEGSQDIRDELLRRLPNHEIHADTHQHHRPPPPPDEGPPGGYPWFGPPPGHMRPPEVRVAVRIGDGTWLNFLIPHQHPESLWQPEFFGPLGAGLLVVLVLSVLAVRRAAKPLNQLAAAAERLGRDVATAPIPEAGPREVRAAAQAFNRMQARLRRFIDDRTQMFAAISHDLRTPITRLKLRAEFVEDDEQRQKMLADLDEMEGIISSSLAFARDDAAREARRPIDIGVFLQQLADDFDLPYHGPDSLIVEVGEIGMRRALANLLDNARKYGQSPRLSAELTDGLMHVFVDDDGPGIPEEELERVFTPFYRLETSRNRSTGGTGLGLAIARSAVRAHGGDIVLCNRADGGLRALVSFPA
ncbi:MAG TPA: HAMP domain-containing protein [Rhodospirillaceae bacterium]|nr:HAMP domain-containing protein [Rhodospirillaceae bacterium]